MTTDVTRPLETPAAEARLADLQRRFRGAEPGQRRPLSTPAVLAISFATFALTFFAALRLLGGG